MHYVVHPQTATIPAMAACAAQQQGKFNEFEKTFFEKRFGQQNDEAAMVALAGELKLNVDKFKSDMSGDTCKKQIADQQTRLSAVGVGGTPAFFINGRFLSGARPIEQFKAVVDEELKKANDAIGSGKATPENYYQKMVVEAGKKSVQ
jgi:protein-disulfide isomerase